MCKVQCRWFDLHVGFVAFVALDRSVAGAGLAVLSTWHADAEIASGKLLRIDLKDATPKEQGIWAVYPTRRQVLPKVRVFVEAMRERLAGPAGVAT